MYLMNKWTMCQNDTMEYSIKEFNEWTDLKHYYCMS